MTTRLDYVHKLDHLCFRAGAAAQRLVAHDHGGLPGGGRVALLLFFSLCLPSSADARPATPDDVDMYIDEYSDNAETALDTCTAYFSRREQDKCIAENQVRWDRRWREKHPLEWGREETASLKQRVSEIDMDLQAKRDEINKQRKRQDNPDPDDYGATSQL